MEYRDHQQHPVAHTSATSYRSGAPAGVTAAGSRSYQQQSAAKVPQPAQHQQCSAASITAGNHITWDDGGKRTSVFVSAVNNDDMQVRHNTDQPRNVIVQGSGRDYTVTEGVLVLTVHWLPKRASPTKQEVAVSVHAAGKVEVEPRYQRTCGKKGEKLDFDGCKVSLGGTSLQRALSQGYWKRIAASIPQQPTTAVSTSGKPPSHLVKVMTFTGDKLVTLASTVIQER
ncbi:hypothetical protein [Anaplasma centrale]|uniref:hypothetical protein n=1 Tax=Anaplasma centrale TaxID=769 RepID=UPI00059F4C96|nr:hypothetical protein [Anaplasma centrale]